MLAGLVRAGRLPAMRLYVDSPMAQAATRITLQHEALLDDETRDLIASGSGHIRSCSTYISWPTTRNRWRWRKCAAAP